MAFFLSLGLCQLLYGPLSDMFGRKRPLYAGLLLFALTSVLCAFAPNIRSLIAWRFVQGVGACAAIVIPRAIVRDLYTGPEAARMMSLLMLVFSVSPLLAPLAGSLAIALASWRAVFFAVAGLALFGLLLTATQLGETRPANQRVESTLASAWAGYRSLLRNRRFVALSFLGGFGMSAFFIYLANSSFVLIQHYGLSPARYSLYFAINAAAFIGSAQLTGHFTQRFGLARVVRVAATGHAAALLLLAVLWFVGFGSLMLLAALLFVGFGFLGLVVPSTTVLALDDHGAIAGTAAALMGTVQMLTGAAVVSLLSVWVDGTPLPLVMGITISSLVTVSLAWWTLAARGEPPVLATEHGAA
jgi:MFS transporter, DHA1 family, multidrug resistance protein